MLSRDATLPAHGKGKARCLKIMRSDVKLTEAFASLGDSFKVSDALMSQMEAFTCRIYGSKATSVATCRYETFCTGAGSEKKLPPTRGALLQHTKRAAHQAVLWKRALVQKVCPPSAHGSGWTIINGKIELVWTEEPEAPENILPLVSCGCASSGFESGRCSCRKACRAQIYAGVLTAKTTLQCLTNQPMMKRSWRKTMMQRSEMPRAIYVCLGAHLQIVPRNIILGIGAL